MSATAEKKKDLLPTEVITPEFRVSYPYVFEPRAADAKGKQKYSLQMLFRVGPSKDGPSEKAVDIAELKAAAMAAAVEKWGADRSKWPKNLHNPFRDGMETGYGDKDGYGQGVVFVSATSDYQPGIVDQRVKPIMDRKQFYPGCYALAKVQAYGWEYMGKAGVSFGLRHVQLVRDGLPLGGGTRPEDDFAPIPMPSASAAGASAATSSPAAADPFSGFN